MKVTIRTHRNMCRGVKGTFLELNLEEEEVFNNILYTVPLSFLVVILRT